MRTISIISQKGGAGKTTLAVHLAAAAATEGVALVMDTDPQATASRWGQWRAGRDPDPPSFWWTPMLAFRSWRGVSDERYAPGVSGGLQAGGC